MRTQGHWPGPEWHWAFEGMVALALVVTVWLAVLYRLFFLAL
jgi:hypothetical protein